MRNKIHKDYHKYYSKNKNYNFPFQKHPDEISLSAPADQSVNAVPGEVWDIGYLGDISIYHVRLATGATLKATVANATRLIERPITWEDKIWLTWSRDGGVVLNR